MTYCEKYGIADTLSYKATTLQAWWWYWNMPPSQCVVVVACISAHTIRTATCPSNCICSIVIGTVLPSWYTIHFSTGLYRAVLLSECSVHISLGSFLWICGIKFCLLSCNYAVFEFQQDTVWVSSIHIEARPFVWMCVSAVRSISQTKAVPQTSRTQKS